MKYTLFIATLVAAIMSCSNPERPKTQVESPQTQEVTQTETASIPSAEVIDFAELETRLAADREGLTLYNFWATWCKPCIEEMPYFVNLDKEMGDKVNVVFISLDNPKNPDRVNAFMEKRGYTQESWLLNPGRDRTWIDNISTDWSGSIPATVFADVSENIRVFKERSYTSAELKEEVNNILK